MFDRSRELVRELGWPSVRAMTEELSGIDLGALAQQTEAFLAATEPSYEDTVEPRLRAELDLGFEQLERADLAYFFRAPSLDGLFPSDQLLPSYEATLAGLGLRNGAGGKRDPRRGAAAEEVTACVLRARARARRGVPRARRASAAARTTTRSCTSPATPSTSRTWTRRCRSSIAGWATTR